MKLPTPTDEMKALTFEDALWNRFRFDFDINPQFKSYFQKILRETLTAFGVSDNNNNNNQNELKTWAFKRKSCEPSSGGFVLAKTGKEALLLVNYAYGYITDTTLFCAETGEIVCNDNN